MLNRKLFTAIAAVGLMAPLAGSAAAQTQGNNAAICWDDSGVKNFEAQCRVIDRRVIVEARKQVTPPVDIPRDEEEEDFFERISFDGGGDGGDGDGGGDGGGR